MKKFFVIVTILAVFAPNKAHAVISFVGSCSANGNNGANATLTLPVGTAENDLVIVAYGNADADNLDFNMVMVTADYTEVADLFSNDNFDANMGVYWKVMGPTPDTEAVADNIGGTDTDTPAVCMVFRGVDTTTPMDVTPTVVQGTNSDNSMDPNPPPIDHNNPSGVWVVIAGANAHNLNAGGFTFPTGYTTDAVDILGDDTADGSVGLGYRDSGVSDPEDPGIITDSGADSTSFAWVAATMALRPAAVVTNPPTVTTNTETNVGNTSGTMNGTVSNNGGEDATTVGFAWGTTSDLTGADTSTTTESGTFTTNDTFSESLFNILSNTTYYFRAYATNPTGTGYGSIDNFATGITTTPSRLIRLFESFRLKLFSGRLRIFQQ